MGNREDLLAAAGQCLNAKGYARTTARDIASTAGVSLAAIGYHFGTKEQLLNAALRQSIEEWGDDLAAVLTPKSELTEAERFEEIWQQVIASFARSSRLWAVQFELLGTIDQQPELKEAFAEASRQARKGLAELFDVELQAVGALYHTLLCGLAAQWLLDPDSVPSGAELRQAMITVTADLG